MKIGFPTRNLDGLDSIVCESLRSASCFVIADTASKEVEELRVQCSDNVNGDLPQHLKTLHECKVDAVAVRDVGSRALRKLLGQGLSVSRSVRHCWTEYCIHIGWKPERGGV